jgi:hypothetical protein
LVIKKLNGEAVDWDKDYMEPMMQGVNTFRSYVMAWYEGTLDTIFFAKAPRQDIKNKICSVLAGYVWDMKNPYVREHDIALQRLANWIKKEEEINEQAEKQTESGDS